MTHLLRASRTSLKIASAPGCLSSASSSEEDIETAAQVCILGTNIVTELFGDTAALGREVKIKVRWRLPPVRCRIIGIMALKGRSLRRSTSLDDIVCVPLTTHQQRLSGIRDVQGLIVFFHKTADVYRVIDSVKKVLRKRHRGTDDFIGYWIPQRSFRRLERIKKVIKIALGGIAGFSMFVSGIGIMKICLVSVGEKTREIGLRIIVFPLGEAEGEIRVKLQRIKGDRK